MMGCGHRYLWMIIVALIVASGPGCASAGGGAHERSSPVARDAAIAAAITARMEEDERLDLTSIRVSVTAGVAVLEGTVASVDQVRRALRHAARVEGVRQVVNRLLVIDDAVPGRFAVRGP